MSWKFNLSHNSKLINSKLLTEVSEVPLDGLESHKAPSPGQRPGYMSYGGMFALKGQKRCVIVLMPFQGEFYDCPPTQGDALGYVLMAFQAVSMHGFH